MLSYSLSTQEGKSMRMAITYLNILENIVNGDTENLD
jgi:hypothetical protein